MSRIQLLTSKISHICQEIRDVKSRRKPQTNIAIQNYTNTGLVEEQTNPNYTRAPDSNNFAKEGSDDEDGLGETYSFHSKQCHRAPNSPDCQEIGLVAFMFFFELLFSYVLRNSLLCFLLLTYSQSFFFLIC